MLLGYTIRFHNITDAAAKMSCVVIASHFSKFPPPPLFLVIFYHRPAPLSNYTSLPLLLFLLNLPIIPIPTFFSSPFPSSPVHLSPTSLFNSHQYHFFGFLLLLTLPFYFSFSFLFCQPFSSTPRLLPPSYICSFHFSYSFFSLLVFLSPPHIFPCCAPWLPPP